MTQQKSKQPALLSSALMSLALSSTPVFADYTQDIEDALNFNHYGNYGAVKADINYRWENVNQDKGPLIPGTKPPLNVKTANANTTRVRLGLLSPTIYDFQGYAEYQGLYALEDDYNQGVLVQNTNYSKIQDPQRNELDQLWLSYKGIDDTVVKFGRQRIKYDDDRFIGNVGWRQLEQTYDAVTILHNYQTLFGLTVNAAYLGHLQDPLGQNAKLSAPLVNFNYKTDWGNVVAYGYWVDFQDKLMAAKSSQTYGLRFDGKSPQFYDTVNFLYTAEWGNQSDYANNPNHYSADRINLMGGVSAFDFTLSGAMEQLDGYGVNKTFNTPLGTNHAFQGWADVIKNPLYLADGSGATAAVSKALGQGIRDIFATAGFKMLNDSIVMTGVYHDFYDDTGSVKFGSEWDFSVMKKFGKHYSLLAKYADFYTANTAFTDTQKIWLQGNITF
jgi:hypothetical protein